MSDPFIPFVPTWLDTPAAADAFNPNALPGLLPGVAPPMGSEQLAAGGGAAPPIPFTAPSPASGPVPIDMQPGLGVPAVAFDQAIAQLPPPAPDTITGGAPPPMPAADVAAPADMSPEQPAPTSGPQPADPYADLSGENPLTNPNLTADDAAAAMLATQQSNPQLAAKFQADWQQNQDEDVAMEALLAARADARRARDNFEAQQRAVEEANRRSAAIEQDAIAQAQKKVDPSRFASSRTTGQRIWDLIGAVAGGAFAGAAGRGDGRNLFLEDWEKQVDRDIDAQKNDIANGWQGIQARRGIVAEMYARSGDLYHASEAARLALKMSARDALLAEAQLYDPRGTRAMRIAQSIAQVDASIAANQRALYEKNLDLQIKLNEEARKQQEAADKHAAAQSKLAGRGAGGAGAGPIVQSRQSFAKKNGIATWGQAEEDMYQAYLAKTQQRGGTAAPASASAAPSTPATAAASPAPVPQAPAAAAAPSGAPRRSYKTKDDWFSENRPTVSAEDKKRYWFVDGNNGNDVPPVELEAGADPEKFIKGQRIRREMAVKADQLRILTEKLQKRGFWDKAVGSKISWKNDADLTEARALAEDFTGLVIQAKEMGVPSGNDIERVKTMVGGDPGGWKDPTPALQRARESLQLEQDADWSTAAPQAAKDTAYNRYRVLPNASPDWVKKFQGRGEVKEVTPELGNTDPRQLQGRTVAGDAPNAVQAAAQDARSTRSKAALQYLQVSGAQVDDSQAAPDELAVRKSTPRQDAPQVRDFTYDGPPQGGDAWRKLRDQHVNNVALLNKYLRSGDVDQWKAFKKGEREAEDALNDLFAANPGLYRKYVAPGANYVDHIDFTPEALARLTGEVLRGGGR